MTEKEIECKFKQYKSKQAEVSKARKQFSLLAKGIFPNVLDRFCNPDMAEKELITICIDKELEMLETLRAECLQLIGLTKDQRQREVLMHLYIDGLTNEKTAELMFYSEKNISRIKRKAIKCIAEVTGN